MLIIFRNSLANGPISLFARNFFSFITTFCLWLFACLPFSPVHVHLSLIISVGLFLPLSSFSSSLFLVLLLLHFSWPLSNFLLSSSSSYLFVFLLILLFLASSSLPLFFHTPHHPSLPPPCSVREKFVEVDLKPVCKHCYERLPDDMKRRLAKRERDSKEKKKKLIPMCLWSSLSPFSSLPLLFLWSVFIFFPFWFWSFAFSLSSCFKHAPHKLCPSCHCYII